MAHIICVASGKGGAGKTTVVANLSAAMARLGLDVVAVDANITTSNLGIHLGIPLYPVTIQDVLTGGAKLKDAMYFHEAGFNVLPADVSLEKLMNPDKNEFLDVFYKVNADFVLIDCAAGLGRDALAAVEASDELLVVTNPDVPAMTDAVKLAKLAEQAETSSIGIVLNKVGYRKYEVHPLEVESFLSLPLVGLIPEDENVKKALAFKTPVVNFKPFSPASREFMLIAARLSGTAYRPPKNWRFWQQFY